MYLANDEMIVSRAGTVEEIAVQTTSVSTSTHSGRYNDPDQYR